MWKNKRNVRIKYTPLEPSSPSVPKENTDRLDDLVSYQSLSNDKVSIVHGVDKAASGGEGRGEWDWRGKGLLMIASSHWEVLGWGEEGGNGNKWLVTMFVKTLFTPAGIDVYSQDRAGLKAETVEGIQKALGEIEDADVKKLAPQVFEIASDNSRTD